MGKIYLPGSLVSLRFTAFVHGLFKAGIDPYKQARNIGTWYGSPPDGSGIPVKIKVNPPKK